MRDLIDKIKLLESAGLDKLDISRVRPEYETEPDVARVVYSQNGKTIDVAETNLDYDSVFSAVEHLRNKHNIQAPEISVNGNPVPDMGAASEIEAAIYSVVDDSMDI